MKYAFAFMALIVLASCAGKPVIVRVKNCRDLGAGLYDCEEINEAQQDPFSRK